jgi:cytochrome c oxidase cbb3-type subunit 3
MMGAVAYRSRFSTLIFSILLSASFLAAQAAKPATPKPATPKKPAAPASGASVAAARGKTLFQRDCSFCHGRDAMGGETGPDLTRSRLVTRDVGGDKIRAVVQNGRTDKGMPAFPKLQAAQLADIIAFLREQTKNAESKPGARRGVDVADLQTGNVEAGRAYFNGPGNCSSCHSPTGDLAGVATRYIGLELEKRMLYPENAKSKLTVTTSSGQTFTGTLVYKDEFHVGMTDADGWYKSWPVSEVQFKIDSPADAHVEQFPKYTDDDIHNLMAYLQTLK